MFHGYDSLWLKIIPEQPPSYAILEKIRLRKVVMAGQWKEIEAEWQGDSVFIGKNLAGGTVQMGMLNDRPGISPMELILVGLAGCTGVDIMDILRKKRQDVKAFKVKVRGLRAETYPMIYKEIEIVYQIWGDHIDRTAVERAIQLSQDKYCSVSAMLRSVAEIRCDSELFETPQT
jgi:putative redox protein